MSNFYHQPVRVSTRVWPAIARHDLPHSIHFRQYLVTHECVSQSPDPSIQWSPFLPDHESGIDVHVLLCFRTVGMEAGLER